MATTVGTEKDLVKLLEDLVYLDRDAISAYDVAIERIEDTTAASKLREFKQDHERHVQDISRVLRNMGEEAPHEGDMKEILTTGKVKLGALMGDNAILRAMKSNEDDTNKAYESAVQNSVVGGDHELRSLLERNLADERRHRAWLESRIR